MSKLIDIGEVRNKKENKKLAMYVISAITVVYIIYAIYLIVRTPTDTATVESGTLTLEESATGYIIREETVVQGDNYKNGIYQIVSEGERAAKKQTIFRYYGKGEEDLQEKIKEIDLQIQEALEKEKLKFPADVKSLEQQIDIKVQDLKSENDLQVLSDYKKQIGDIILKKATIAGENSKSGSYIKKLVSQRENYQKKLVEDSEYVLAPVSGVVSYRVDGLENVLTTKGLEDLTIKELEGLDVKTGKLVASSNQSAKVIDNFGCYIAVVLNSDAAKNAKIGQKVQITLASGNETVATINNIRDESNGKKIVIFRLRTLTDELISYRKISFNITWWNVSGIKAPNSSIEEDENGNKYVIKKTSFGKEKCLIKILKANDKYSIISSFTADDLKALNIDISEYNGISEYDTIMLHPGKK